MVKFLIEVSSLIEFSQETQTLTTNQILKDVFPGQGENVENVIEKLTLEHPAILKLAMKTPLVVLHVALEENFHSKFNHFFLFLLFEVSFECELGKEVRHMHVYLFVIQLIIAVRSKEIF